MEGACVKEGKPVERVAAAAGAKAKHDLSCKVLVTLYPALALSKQMGPILPFQTSTSWFLDIFRRSIGAMKSAQQTKTRFGCSKQAMSGDYDETSNWCKARLKES